ncbi:nitroreductase family protein [Roseibium sp.]|uniref:nitroreductase family protein n=1 Tax=Roseibium sp. TaxID=1936156 RepID=UPI003A96B6E1
MTIHVANDIKLDEYRNAEHPVEPLFVGRWSPRAYDGSQMPQADLMTILEAARWAPSAYNVQPWRFVYALRGDANWDKLLDLLNPFNKDWAQRASALVFLFSDKLVDQEGAEPLVSGTHSFDAGAAWAQAALQATALGYHAHAMAGLMHDDIPAALNVPERYKIEIAFAVGRRGDVSVLPEALQERDLPSPRLPLSKTAFAGGFKAG